MLKLGQNYNLEYSLANKIKYKTLLKTLNQIKEISNKNLQNMHNNMFRINKKFKKSV